MRRFVILIPILALACDQRAGGGSFGVSPPASRLAITLQPGNVAATAAIIPGVQVSIQNAEGQTVARSDVTITMIITPGTGAAGAVLSGATNVVTIDGLSVFNNLRINLAGTGYRLTASAPGMTASTSNAFDVTP